MKKSTLINSISLVYEPIFRHESTNARKTATCNWVTEETKAAVRRWLTEDIEFSKAIDAAANKFIKKDPVNLAEQWLIDDMIMNSGFDAHKNRDGSYTMVPFMFNR